jgi:hypothetical protein
MSKFRSQVGSKSSNGGPWKLIIEPQISQNGAVGSVDQRLQICITLVRNCTQIRKVKCRIQIRITMNLRRKKQGLLVHMYGKNAPENWMFNYQPLHEGIIPFIEVLWIRIHLNSIRSADPRIRFSSRNAKIVLSKSRIFSLGGSLKLLPKLGSTY